MLNIHFGRESVQKENFIFDHIEGKTLLLVPDQFTLEAEQRAFSILGVKGLMDLEIISPSRLGFRILSSVGGSKITPIDQYGRHMLLTKILAEEGDGLQAFKGLEKTISFVELMNNLISEMKQYDTSPDKLKEILSNVEPERLLHRKLSDILKIYERYEAFITGKYIDTEDYIDLYLSKMEKYEEIKSCRVWVWGFDYFTPKNRDLLRMLMVHSAGVHVMLTYDQGSRDEELFQITGSMIRKLLKMAEEEGIRADLLPIPERYTIPLGDAPGQKAIAIGTVEKELFSIPLNTGTHKEGITLVHAANIYAEMETAATFILEMVRNREIRFRDIAVICNEMEIRGSILKRTFEDYGIPVFLDTKRSVMHNPVIEFVASLVDMVTKGWMTQDVFRYAKTGLTALTLEEVEELENYAIKYRIRGSLWRKAFEKGTLEYEVDGLQRMNEIREKLTAPILEFEEIFNKAETVEEKVVSLYEFLSRSAGIPDKLDQMAEMQLESNNQETAEETSQIWNILVGIFEQLHEILGREKMSGKEFTRVLSAGFQSIEIGLLPPTADRVMVGTMQRTRASGIKALLVVGANDGILPQEAVTEGLLSEDEKAGLYEREVEICKIDALRIREEKLAIYKTLSMPERALWMSCSMTDVEGKELKPSSIFEQITQVFPDLDIRKDIISEKDPMQLLAASENGLKHLTSALRKGLEGEPIEEEWQQAVKWYRKQNPEQVNRLAQGIFYTGKLENLQRNTADRLYRKDLTQPLKLSPSSIEKFGRCPFSFLMAYGIKPEERRMYEVAGREIGDIYHACLMKLSMLLSTKGQEITDENSRWKTISREECMSLVDEIVEAETTYYKEGLMLTGAAERYKKDRIKKVCGQVAWVLVEHVREGSIKRIEFEAEFGNGPDKIFPAVEINIGSQTVLLEGKIDRVDVLSSNRAKIIDYKSGREKFDMAEAKAGYRLQLMLYLKAAQDAIDKEKVGGGVFYFQIDEPMVDATPFEKVKIKEKVESETAKKFRLDGIMLDDAEVIRSIAGDFEGFSNIFSLRSTAEGIKGTSTGKLLSEEEFAELRQAVESKLQELCGELVKGNVQAKPKKTKTAKACDYCPYKSICSFDVIFDGCEYEVIS